MGGRSGKTSRWKRLRLLMFPDHYYRVQGAWRKFDKMHVRGRRARYWSSWTWRQHFSTFPHSGRHIFLTTNQCNARRTWSFSSGLYFGLFHPHNLIWSCCLVWMRRAKNCRNCQSWECMFAAEHYPAHSKAVSADELRSPLLRFGGTAIAWSSLSTLVSIFRHFQHKRAPLPAGEAGC